MNNIHPIFRDILKSIFPVTDMLYSDSPAPGANGGDCAEKFGRTGEKSVAPGPTLSSSLLNGGAGANSIAAMTASPKLRIKGAEMFPDGKGSYYVICPHCPEEREVDEPGIYRCLNENCDREFEAWLADLPTEEGYR